MRPKKRSSRRSRISGTRAEVRKELTITKTRLAEDKRVSEIIPKQSHLRPISIRGRGGYIKIVPTLAFLILSAPAVCWGQLPDAPSKVIDRNFWLLTSWSAASTFADGATTVLQVGHSQACFVERGSPWLYGRKPQFERTSVAMSGLFVASVFASYELKKHHAHIWRIPLWSAPQSFLALEHTVGGVHNLRTCQ